MLNPRVKRIASLAEKAAGLALALVLVSLPITSLPILSKLAGGTMVAPPATVFLFLAAVLWIPFHLLGRGKLPCETKPFLAFAAVACLSSLAAFFLPIETYKGHAIVREEISALITLASAFVFYLVFSVWYQDESRLKNALKLLNLGGLAIVIWGFAQIIVIYLFQGNYPAWMVKFHDLLSIRSLSNNTFSIRVTGFAYEPSWLAHQLNVLYIPFWLASTVIGYSAHQRRFLRLSVENLLLVGGIVLLAFSWSRIGLLAFLLAVAFLVYRFSAYLVKRILQRMKLTSRSGQFYGRFLEFGVIVGLFALYAAVTVGFLFAVSRLDPRLARLFNLRVLPADPFSLALRLAFAERLIYWQVGWNVFAHYPLLGVGLGNVGFFFQSNLPFQGQMLNEILSTTTIANFVPNIKSMWVRLLAETGIVGFSIFSAWLYILWLANRLLRDNPSPTLKVVGWMGALAVIAYLAEGFSVDSFALPYLWVSLGLVTAASALVRRNVRPCDPPSK
jgi:hypothetical protein